MIHTSTTTKRAISTFTHADWQAGRKSSNAAKAPSVQELEGCPTGGVSEARQRQIVIVANDEVMRHVKRRESPAPSVVERINVVAKSRSIVEGLGEGIGPQEAECPDPPLQTELHGVVS